MKRPEHIMDAWRVEKAEHVMQYACHLLAILPPLTEGNPPGWDDRQFLKFILIDAVALWCEANRFDWKDDLADYLFRNPHMFKETIADIYRVELEAQK